MSINSVILTEENNVPNLAIEALDDKNAFLSSTHVIYNILIIHLLEFTCM